MGAYGSGVYGGGIYGGATALSFVVQDRYPDRVLLTATGIVPGNLVTISRSPAGSTVRTPVRLADQVEPISDALIVVDAEQPFGVELTYRLTVDDSIDLDSELVTVTLAGSKVALSDAISGLAAEVVISAWSSKRKTRELSVFSVDGRNIVVAGDRSGFEGTIELFIETDDSREVVEQLLQTATSGVLQIRQAGPYSGVDAYIAVQSDDEQRFSQDGSDERRLIALEVVETGSWAPTLESLTFTLADIAAAYPGGTLATIAADYGSLLAIAQGDYS